MEMCVLVKHALKQCDCWFPLKSVKERVCLNGSFCSDGDECKQYFTEDNIFKWFIMIPYGSILYLQDYFIWHIMVLDLDK